jgi:uncharacterized protein YndB with AHSA1/START domain
MKVMKDVANLMETWSLDREIVLVKLLNHRREKVFAAWMDPKALTAWYGPAGFSIETQEADIREGGIWRCEPAPNWDPAEMEVTL